MAGRMRLNRVHCVPFDGTPPEVAAGNAVLCRTAFDAWVPKVALAAPRYDHEHRFGQTTYLTVPVADVSDWKIHGERAEWVNWPAGDVRKAER